MKTDNCWEYMGNLHIHTRRSDGAGSVAEIAAAARCVGCDFIMLNDHAHQAGGLHLEDAGWYDSVLVLVGAEIGQRYHHYLVYGIEEWIRDHEGTPQTTIDRVAALGGLGFLAHPFEKGMPYRERSVAYTWNDLKVRGFTGISIWNYASRWKERIRSPWLGLYCLAFKALSLKGPSRRTMSFYDLCCREGRVIAIGASDAHGSRYRLGRFSFVPLSYRRLMRSVNVHILLDRPLERRHGAAAGQIYQALREGRLYVAHDGLHAARGFRMEFRPEGDGRRLGLGDEAPFIPGKLRVTSPARGRIQLVGDGRPLEAKLGRAACFDIVRPGVYRIEIHLRYPLFGWRAWIFSNPVYLR